MSFSAARGVVGASTQGGPRSPRVGRVKKRLVRLGCSMRGRAVLVVVGALLLASAAAVGAQPSPWRLAQGGDGTLYLLADGQRFTIQPDAISDDEVANLPDGGAVGSVLLAALPVSEAGPAARTTTPVAQSTPLAEARPAPTPIALVTPTAPVGTRQNPVPVGTSAVLADGWQVVVISTQPDATARVVALDPGNVAPSSAYQFFLATISVTNPGAAIRAFRARERLRAVGAASVPYFAIDNACGVIPNPFVESDVPSGAALSGNLCWTIQSSDVGTLALYDVPPLSNTDADVTRVYFASHR
jgi:hypothetical protein